MKRTVLLLLTLLLCLSLCACGEDATTPTTSIEDTTTPNITTPTLPNTTAPTEPNTTVPTTPNTTVPTAPVECSHHYQIKETVSSTCTETGLTVYACSHCGHSYQVEMPVTNHDYTPATCADPKTCTYCKKSEGAPLGHSYGILESVSPSCTAVGYTEYTCSRCSDSYTDDIPKTSHDYAAATCTQPKTCRTCGATSGSALGHNYVDLTCARCGDITSNFAIPEEGYDGSEVTITFYHTMGYALRDVLDSYIKDFNKLYPNIHIVHQSVGGWSDIEAHITATLASGTGPNIAYCYPEHVATYNQSGAVVNLDGLIGSTIQLPNGEILGMTSAQTSNFIAGFYNEGRQFGDGLMYSLPLSKSTEVLYYDKTFFEEHNLKVPTTWDEMEALCEKILQIDPNCIPFGYDSESNWFINMCAQYGSDYTSATGEHYLFNNATNRDFVARFREWYEKGYFTTLQLYGSYCSSLFTSTSGTRCYMAIGSTGGARHQLPDNSEFEVGIASIPQANPSSPKVISQGPSLCLFQSENSQEVIASWLFMKFLTTNDAFQAEFSMASGYMPVITSVLNNPIYSAYLSKADGYSYISALATKVALSQEDFYFTPPAFPGSSHARTVVGQLLVNSVCMSDNGDPTALIAHLFEEAVKTCQDPSYGQKTEEEEPEPEIPTSGTILLWNIYAESYVTGTTYQYTTGSGNTKLELELSTGSTDAQVFTLVDNGDGTISFMTDSGTFLYCDANDVTLTTTQSDYTKYVLEAADGGYYIRCAVANYNGTPQYLEVYNGYLTCYSMYSSSNLALYTFIFEEVD